MISQTAAIIQFSSIGVKCQDALLRELLAKFPEAANQGIKAEKVLRECWLLTIFNSIASGK